MKLILAIVLGLWLGDPAVAKPKTLLDSLLVPAPPHYEIVKGAPAGVLDGAPVATDVATGTIYHDGPMDAFSRAHEMGHLLDAQVLTDGDRHYFQRTLHAPGGAWNSGTGHKGYSSPDEWFADYYAAAATKLDLGQGNVGSYAQLGPKRLARFAAAMDRLGRRRGLLPYS